jgi:hypothetical protein
MLLGRGAVFVAVAVDEAEGRLAVLSARRAKSLGTAAEARAAHEAWLARPRRRALLVAGAVVADGARVVVELARGAAAVGASRIAVVAALACVDDAVATARFFGACGDAERHEAREQNALTRPRNNHAALRLVEAFGERIRQAIACS